MEENKNLTKEQKRILFGKATEPPFTGKFLDEHREGVFMCANCGNPLFLSNTKYDSGSGWPSFYAPFSDTSIKTRQDTSHEMVRTEVVCGKCGAHLGHLFSDGPKPSGQRYCVNSNSLDFKTKKIK